MKLDRKYLKLFFLIDLIIISAVLWFFFVRKAPDVGNKTEPSNSTTQSINSFEECAAAGNPIMESFPEQCSANGKTFTKTVAPTNMPETPSVSDDNAILAVLVANCAKTDATVADGAKKIISANMNDPALYVKEGSFARVAVGCVEGEGGYRSFLQKKANAWTILGSGQMNTISCTALDGTGVPKTITTTCFDEMGEERTIK